MKEVFEYLTRNMSANKIRRIDIYTDIKVAILYRIIKIKIYLKNKTNFLWAYYSEETYS